MKKNLVNERVEQARRRCCMDIKARNCKCCGAAVQPAWAYCHRCMVALVLPKDYHAKEQEEKTC